MKVFIHQHEIHLIESGHLGVKSDKDVQSLTKSDRQAMFSVVEKLLRDKEAPSIWHFSGNNYLKLKQDFFSLFKEVAAAGGVVTNANDELLIIFRRGCWDLPKGKIDPGERKEEAAVREVQEETGLEKILLGPAVSMAENQNFSLHVYEHKKRWVIKPTYWFNMMHYGTGHVEPQLEEDITEVRWITRDKLEMVFGNTYPSIVDVIKASAYCE